MKRDGFRRLGVPSPYAPFAKGGFPTPSGKCEFFSATLAAQGQDLIDWAEREMPVLRLIRARFLKEQPLKGLKLAAISYSLGERRKNTS